MAVKQVTLRLPEVGYERLQTFSERHGVSFRGIFEATTIVSLQDENDINNREMQLEIWRVVKRLQDSEEFKARPRRKVIARLDDELASQLADSCRRHGVTVSAALAAVVMPWSVEDSDTSRVHRAKNLERIVELGRHLDHQRRRRLGPN